MPNTQFRWVATISALQNESGMVNGEIAAVHGYTAAGDGGGGFLDGVRKRGGAVRLGVASPHFLRQQRHTPHFFVTFFR